MLTLRRNVDLTKPRDVKEVLKDLYEATNVFANDGHNRFDAADVRLIANVLNKDYASEKNFDEELFLVLRKVLFNKHQQIQDVGCFDDVAPGADLRKPGVASAIKSFGTGLVAIVSPRKKIELRIPVPTIRSQDDQKADKFSQIKPIAFYLPQDNDDDRTDSLRHEGKPEQETIGPRQELYLAALEEQEVGLLDRVKTFVGNITSPTKRKCHVRQKAAARVPQRELELDPIVLLELPGEETGYPMYAIGIARQANGEKGSSGNSSGSTGSGLAANSKMDHCSCLLEKTKRGSKWTVKRCFSVVELTFGTDNECILATVEDNKTQGLQIGSASGAVAQALAYTMGWVLPSHASLGKQDEDLTDLSWTAIVGKKKVESANAEMNPIMEDDERAGNTKETNADEDDTKSFGYPTDPAGEALPSKHRWVAGKIYIPERCGDIFEYSVTCCGNLDEDESISIYLETLLFGLRAAKKLLEAIQANVEIIPLPSSGRRLNFGGIDLPNLKLQGKTKVGTNLCTDPDADTGHWMLSQGEIFTGKINFHLLKNDLSSAKDSIGSEDAIDVIDAEEDSGGTVDDDIDAELGICLAFEPQKSHDYVLFKEDDTEVDVVVKVSSLSVHKYLNHPDKAWQALQKIQSEYLMNPNKRWDLFNVLYAAENLTNSLITVMADLSKDYKVLTPEKDSMSLPVAWTGFQDLVMRVLVPLADIGVIHPDIRPGWNVTSNILYSHFKRPSMQIIDFDSFVLHYKWVPPDSSMKYISKDKTATAFTFLWWQCVAVAYAWYIKVNQRQMEQVNLEKTLKDGTDEFSTRLGKNFCDFSLRRDIGKVAFLKLLKFMSVKLAAHKNELS